METLKQFELSRFFTLKALENVDERKWDVLPDGFSNTIRWNAGHIYVATESLLHKADNNYEVKNAEWGAFFAPGTRPSEWKEGAPSMADIFAALEDQSSRVIAHFEGNLTDEASEALQIAFNNMQTVEAIVQFVTWHEGIHSGIIKSFNHAVK